MRALTLTKTRLFGGTWEGIVSGAGETEPKLTVLHRDQTVEGVETEARPDGDWTLRIPIPPHAIADGVQTFTIFDEETEARLGHFSILAGEAVADDIRAEMELLRAELDLLKRAFRRHCLEGD